MRRRDLLASFGVTILARARPAFGQATKPLPEIAVLMAGRADDPADQALLAAFKSGLSAFGWDEGTTIHIEYRWGDTDDDRIRAHALELVRRAPRMILTSGAPAIVALKQATSTIPIVFAGASDPVGAGLVESLPRPGGNITGFSHFDYAYCSKWIDYLKQMVPDVARLVVLGRPTDPSTGGYLKVIGPVASSLGLDTLTAEIVHADDIEPALERAVKSKSRTGLLVLPDLILPSNRERIVKAAARHQLPATYPNKIYASAGGLMSYSTDRPALFHLSASYVDHILRGEKPADLPVQSPTTFDLVINLKTAKALGLTVPHSLLARADEVIE
jgi:ABC-type uncharacterized transport system substrate-binding protein